MINYLNLVSHAYPVSEAQIRAENPFTSFPIPFAPTDDYAPVAVLAVPPYARATQTAVATPPDLTQRGWEQGWRVVELTPTQQAEVAVLIQNDIINDTQQRLDDFAKTRNYDGILSACTYASSTVLKFQQEGQYCVDQRDATWATLYVILGQVQQGLRPMPNGYDDIKGELPVLEWPQ